MAANAQILTFVARAIYWRSSAFWGFATERVLESSLTQKKSCRTFKDQLNSFLFESNPLDSKGDILNLPRIGRSFRKSARVIRPAAIIPLAGLDTRFTEPVSGFRIRPAKASSSAAQSTDRHFLERVARRSRRMTGGAVGSVRFRRN